MTKVTIREECKLTFFNEGFFHCELPKGHEGQHRYTMLWDDEDVV